MPTIIINWVILWALAKNRSFQKIIVKCDCGSRLSCATMYCIKKLISKNVNKVTWQRQRGPNPSGGTNPERTQAHTVPIPTIITEKAHRNGVVLETEAFADDL